MESIDRHVVYRSWLPRKKIAYYRDKLEKVARDYMLLNQIG